MNNYFLLNAYQIAIYKTQLYGQTFITRFLSIISFYGKFIKHQMVLMFSCDCNCAILILKCN